MTYSFVTDELEVRSSFKDKVKKTLVRGYASFKGLDTYNTELSSKARKRVSEDLKARELKVGAQHQAALGNKAAKRLMELKSQLQSEGKSTRLIDEALNLIKVNRLPLGKPREVIFEEDGVFVEVELNPYLGDIEPEYYNAVVNSLNDGFLDGFSIEFNSADTYDEYDSNGKRKTIIDDLVTTGLELVGGAANSGTRITDVLVRMAGVDEHKTKEEETKMDKQKEVVSKEDYDKIVKEKQELEKQVGELEKVQTETNEDLEKSKEAAEKAKKEAEDEAKSVKEELGEVKELLKENLEKGKLTSAKGVVRQEDKYGKPTEGSDNPKTEEELRKELDGKSMSELVGQIPEYNK